MSNENKKENIENIDSGKKGKSGGRTVGRGLKLTNKFLEVGREVLKNESNVLAWTEEDVIDEINYILKEKGLSEFTISYTTFKNYKNGKYTEDLNLTNDEKDAINELLSLHKRILRNQKTGLTTLVGKADNGWQRFSWLLERKFHEYNVEKIKKEIEIDIKKGLEDGEGEEETRIGGIKLVLGNSIDNENFIEEENKSEESANKNLNDNESEDFADND